MARILVVPVGRGAAREAGVPEDLAGETRALLVVGLEDAGGLEGTEQGDVVLLGKGEEYGLYRARGGAIGCPLDKLGDTGLFELSREGQGPAVVRGDIVGILKKFVR